MTADHTTGLTLAESRRRLDRTLNDPPAFQRPARWTFSKAWQRAQTEEIVPGATRDPARYTVLLGDGDPHTVLFAIHRNRLRAECDCGAYQYHYQGTWCPHVAALWWRWAAEGLLVVADLDAGTTHTSPPADLRIDDQARPLPSAREARADGGTER